jgi:hypothetical protein
MYDVLYIQSLQYNQYTDGYSNISNLFVSKLFYRSITLLKNID